MVATNLSIAPRPLTKYNSENQLQLYVSIMIPLCIQTMFHPQHKLTSMYILCSSTTTGERSNIFDVL